MSFQSQFSNVFVGHKRKKTSKNVFTALFPCQFIVCQTQTQTKGKKGAFFTIPLWCYIFLYLDRSGYNEHCMQRGESVKMHKKILPLCLIEEKSEHMGLK